LDRRRASLSGQHPISRLNFRSRFSNQFEPVSEPDRASGHAQMRTKRDLLRLFEFRPRSRRSVHLIMMCNANCSRFAASRGESGVDPNNPDRPACKKAEFQMREPALAHAPIKPSLRPSPRKREHIERGKAGLVTSGMCHPLSRCVTPWKIPVDFSRPRLRF